eukprot:GHVT01079899.1.p1 GENE.GHVT01079899.1~~GHVT01079899.1.p1  ORF type:complete len:176 (+),score=20.54 GHVT01079899.1:1392-1919(+)
MIVSTLQAQQQPRAKAQFKWAVSPAAFRAEIRLPTMIASVEGTVDGDFRLFWRKTIQVAARPARCSRRVKIRKTTGRPWRISRPSLRFHCTVAQPTRISAAFLLEEEKRRELCMPTDHLRILSARFYFTDDDTTLRNTMSTFGRFFKSVLVGSCRFASSGIGLHFLNSLAILFVF